MRALGGSPVQTSIPIALEFREQRGCSNHSTDQAGGHVIGIDMTPDMLGKARRNAETGGYENVEFRLGEIERLPVADAIILSAWSACPRTSGGFFVRPTAC